MNAAFSAAAFSTRAFSVEAFFMDAAVTAVPMNSGSFTAFIQQKPRRLDDDEVILMTLI